MDFENLAKTWKKFGEQDPLWSVLSEDQKQGNQWDVENFYHTGSYYINNYLKELEIKGILGPKSRSLDFGCGVGRLTFPLANHFEESHGVDISLPMLKLATKQNESFGHENCFFHHNLKNDLSLFEDGSFDFIISLIVLQHMEPRYFVNYLVEFMRLLKPDGVLVFQLPVAVENRASYLSYEAGMNPEMEVFGMDQDDVVAFLKGHGGNVIESVEDHACGDETSYRYVVKHS